MSQILKRYATPFTTALFLISLVTGIALFLHVGPGSFHSMHEILSLVLVLPFALHVWRNWRAFAGYFRHLPMAVALVVSVVAAGLFMVPAGGDAAAGGPPAFQLARRLAGASVEAAAPVMGTTPAELAARLAAGGIPVSDPALPMTQAAEAAGKDPAALMALLAGG